MIKRGGARRISRLLHAAAVILLAVLVSGCAVTSTTVMDEEVVTNTKPMSTYKALLIRDFEMKRELYTDTPENRMGERDRMYARMPSELAESIERYARSHKIFPEIFRNGQPTERTLVLKGKFTRVGRFRISITGTLHDGATDQEVAYFRQTLWDVLDTAAALAMLARETADFIDRIQYK